MLAVLASKCSFYSLRLRLHREKTEAEIFFLWYFKVNTFISLALASRRCRIISNFNFIVIFAIPRRRRWTNQRDYVRISDKKESKEKKKIWSWKVRSADFLIWRFIEEIWLRSKKSRLKNEKACKQKSGSHKEWNWRFQQCNISFYFDASWRLFSLKDDERITFEI